MPIVFSSSSFGAAPESGLDRYSLTAAEAVDGHSHSAAEAAARACDRARRAVKGLGDSLVILEARKSRILSVRAGWYYIFLFTILCSR